MLGRDAHGPTIDVEAGDGELVACERGVGVGEAVCEVQLAGDVGGDVGEPGELANEVFLGASDASVRAPQQVDGGVDHSSASR